MNRLTERALKGRSSRAATHQCYTPFHVFPALGLRLDGQWRRRVTIHSRAKSKPNQVKQRPPKTRLHNSRGVAVERKHLSSPSQAKRSGIARAQTSLLCVPVLGDPEYHVRVYRVSPPATMFGFYRRALWVQGCGLCVNTAEHACCGVWGRRSVSSRQQPWLFYVLEDHTQQKAKGSAALRFGAPPPPPDHTLSSHVVYSYTAGGTAAPGEQRLPKPPN